MKTIKNKKTAIGGIIVLLLTGWISMSFVYFTNIGEKKPWVVPEKFKTMKNPVKSDATTLSAAKALFNKHCKSCHGGKGLGDGAKAKELKTDCGDFSKAEFQSQTDGELFYKTKEGREDMPTFKKKLPDDEDIWSVVNYMRTMGETK